MTTKWTGWCGHACMMATMIGAATITLIPLRTVGAQTVVLGSTGIEFRSSGDTIWRTRDTTASRSVFHGDTVIKTSYMHGVEGLTSTYIVTGDMARLVASRDASGAPKPEPNEGREWPVVGVTIDRLMLELTIRNRGMQELAGSELPLLSNDAPLRSRELRTYPVSANRTIYQHGDTVQYVTGCAEAGPIRTTVYLIYSVDSLRRLSPDPRTFGASMVRAVLADMSGVLLQMQASGGAPRYDGFPGPRKRPCDKR